MENFIVSARKYRPSTFESVVGQQHITGTLKNAIKNNQLAQAFLFCGPRGVGKTTCARILAKTINCTNLTADLEACGTCPSCVSFQSGASFNFHELDAASNNSVDDIRSLVEQVRIPPQAGKYKIYIIDEVHMLSASAFNAFLKTLEEPPAYAIFILATTEKHKILPTILSRCQIFDFNRIQTEDIAAHLNRIAERENIAVEADGLHVIAQKADGGLRDALSMFDQIVSFTSKNITYRAVIENLNILDYDYYFKLTGYLTSANLSEALLLFDEVLNHGFDGNNFINGLASHLRNLLVGKDAQTIRLLEVSDNIKQKYLLQAKETSVSFILTALNLANQCDQAYKNSKNQRLQVELALIKMCHIPSVLQLAQQPFTPAVTDADQIKKKINVTPAAPAVVPAAAPIQKTPEPAIPSPEVPSVPQVSTPPAPAPASAAPKTSIPLLNEIVLKPQPATKNPAATLIPSLTSFQDLTAELESKEPKFIQGSDQESFSVERLMELWNAYAHRAKEEGKINVFTLLTSNDPVVEGDQITILIENKIQESILQDELVYFLNYLRAQLRNFHIHIVTKKVEVQLKNRLYTSIEKYQYMVEKNPLLEEMRKKFNLDVNS